MARWHDLVVIGMGVAGEEVAGTAAEAGMDVLGIERKLVGGECPYWGCIPSKMMVRAANSLAETGRVGKLAGRATVTTDWSPVARRIRQATADWDDEIAVRRFEKQGGTFLRGHVVGSREVEVGGQRVRTRRGFVIATGGEPSVPPVKGLEEVGYWTNREALEATEAPSSLLVLGAGPVGLELAQAFARFGTRVTLVETADHALPAEEPEQGAAMDQYRAVPRVTFTDPEVASVGLSEAQARQAGLTVRVGVAPTASTARGWIHGPGAEHGVIKLVADADQGVLVGGSVMGPAAGEIAGLLVLAIRERIPVVALRELIYPYPTFVRGVEDALRQL